MSENEGVQASDSIESTEAPEGEIEATEADASSEGMEAAEEAPKAPAKAAQKALEKQLKKLKLKVDGRDEELEYDPEDSDFLTKQFQLAKVAQKRMGEFSQLEKDVREFVELLKSNPKKILADPSIGIDIKQLAASIIEEEIENAKKSPEQLEKEAMQAELKAMKDEREKERQENQTREFERLQKQETERYDTLFTKALETGGLPKTPYIVKKMADYVALGIENGIDVTPEDVLPLVKDEMQRDIKEMFATMPDEVIEGLIGSEKLNSMRKKRVAAAKAAPPTPLNKAVKDTGTAAPKPGTDKKISFKDFFKL